MKISRSSKARAAGRSNQVMRLVQGTSKNYRWWQFQETEPAEGYVLEDYSYYVEARPQPPKPVTRKSPHAKLSRTALRKRLYRHHVPKSMWPQLLTTYGGRAQVITPGEPTVKEKWGYSVSKAVTRHVGRLLVVLDEYGAYVPPGLSDMFREMRKYSGVITTVNQDIADFDVILCGEVRERTSPKGDVGLPCETGHTLLPTLHAGLF